MKKRSHSTGSDVVTYLKEMSSQKERETELKEKQMENKSKAEQDLTNLLQQQICHQQEQAQQLIQQQQLCTVSNITATIECIFVRTIKV